jgi:hypothetical protein
VQRWVGAEAGDWQASGSAERHLAMISNVYCLMRCFLLVWRPGTNCSSAGCLSWPVLPVRQGAAASPENRAAGLQLQLMPSNQNLCQQIGKQEVSDGAARVPLDA